MLKKRIVITAITLSLCLPGLSSAMPLSWTPRPDLFAGLTQLWDLFSGAHHGAPALSAHIHRKNGAAIDPNGSPTPPPPGTSNSTTPSDPPASGS